MLLIIFDVVGTVTGVAVVGVVLKLFTGFALGVLVLSWLFLLFFVVVVVVAVVVMLSLLLLCCSSYLFSFC